MSSLFHPDCYVSSLEQIDIGRLKEKGIRLVLLDNDNTIGSSLDDQVSEEARRFVNALKREKIHAMILSNNFSHAAKNKAAQLGLSYHGFCLKPLAHSYVEAMTLYGVRAEECVMIGDQVITDIAGAKHCHMHTILIDHKDQKDHIFGYAESLAGLALKLFIRDIPSKGDYYDHL